MAFGSYSYALTKRDADYCIKLLDSKWWQERWGDKVELKKKELRNITTTFGGIRAGVSVGGQTLGIRANIVVADDPLNILEVDSENARSNVQFWWENGMRSRGDVDLRELVIAQRLHDNDLIGYLQREIGGYQELVLPAEYDPTRKCVTFTEEGTKFWEDPRTEENELLFEEKFPRSYLDERRGEDDGSRNMFAAMQQQDPVQPGGNIVKTNWLRYYGTSPEEMYKECSTAILSCDLAVKSKKTSSYSVIQIWGRRHPNIYLIDQLRRRLSFVGEVEAIQMMVDKWNNAKGPHLSEKLIEDKASGSPATEMLQNQVQGIILFDGNDDKDERMRAITWLFQGGNVYFPGKPSNDGSGKVDFSHVPWMVEFIDEITRYPKASFTDQAVTMSQALLHISRQMQTPTGYPTTVDGHGYMDKFIRSQQSARLGRLR
jgi:predicted phage terminase large subunit-like protein